jgi:hypothetical protein
MAVFVDLWRHGPVTNCRVNGITFAIIDLRNGAMFFQRWRCCWVDGINQVNNQVKTIGAESRGTGGYVFVNGRRESKAPAMGVSSVRSICQKGGATHQAARSEIGVVWACQCEELHRGEMQMWGLKIWECCDHDPWFEIYRERWNRTYLYSVNFSRGIIKNCPFAI